MKYANILGPLLRNYLDVLKMLVGVILLKSLKLHSENK